MRRHRLRRLVSPGIGNAIIVTLWMVTTWCVLVIIMWIILNWIGWV